VICVVLLTNLKFKLKYTEHLLMYVYCMDMNKYISQKLLYNVHLDET